MATRKRKNDPKLCLHRASKQGYVFLNSQNVYLGRYDLPETKEKYHRLLAEWHAGGCNLPVTKVEITVVELCANFWKYAQEHYSPDGRPTDSLSRVKQALRPLRDLYGSLPAANFGPLALTALRQTWIDKGLARTTINDYTSTLKGVFRWAASKQMVDGTVYENLRTVEGLERGRSSARETENIQPAGTNEIEAIRPYVSRQIWALIRLQLLTGARGGELFCLRSIDIDVSGKVWKADLKTHKMSHKGKDRILYFGPKAQDILKEFMHERPLDAFLFSPREAENERHAIAPTHRRPDQKSALAKTGRKVGVCYTVDSYRRAINRGCRSAKVPVWTPHQLRHTFATRIRKDFGLEAAQVLLGHARADVTQLYAERDEFRAKTVVEKSG